MKRNILFLLLSLQFCSCVINPHKEYTYSTGLPQNTYRNYLKINKNKYEDFFIEDLYITVNIQNSDYDLNVIGKKQKYNLFFDGISKEKYEKLIINNCVLINNHMETRVLSNHDFVYQFKQSKINNPMQLWHTVSDNPDFSYIPIDIDYKKKETIQLKVNVSITKQNCETITKEIVYRIKPNYSFTLVEWIWSNW